MEVVAPGWALTTNLIGRHCSKLFLLTGYLKNQCERLQMSGSSTQSRRQHIATVYSLISLIYDAKQYDMP